MKSKMQLTQPEELYSQLPGSGSYTSAIGTFRPRIITVEFITQFFLRLQKTLFFYHLSTRSPSGIGRGSGWEVIGEGHSSSLQRRSILSSELLERFGRTFCLIFCPAAFQQAWVCHAAGRRAEVLALRQFSSDVFDVHA